MLSGPRSLVKTTFGRQLERQCEIDLKDGEGID